jgi:hypothetical protein
MRPLWLLAQYRSKVVQSLGDDPTNPGIVHFCPTE